ncbi:hypothetical protein KQ51_00079 [Candidatus Izimaplasma bacterium HR1]|jgi:hypothetical protein|uniref:hypothetical protein n=1 Tax=Candidatus Izimoplasma sp. HR1 TaxID=1541959 RepID=UPI0004F683F2|nr:hypothetical protein KQ51_00079 [Candidatus Izimaplasma bacterium HR1]
MSLSDLYYLEVEGIANTITSYTVNNFIKAYTKQLLSLDPKKDLERIKVILERLIVWYENNMSLIQHSKFVSNKEEHQKSYSLLIELKGKLDK